MSNDMRFEWAGAATTEERDGVFNPNKCNPKITINTKIEYKAKFVILKVKYQNIGSCTLKRLVTSNCSKGEFIKKKF